MKKASGKGTITDDNGDVYEGEYQDTEPHGVGKMTYKDGGRRTEEANRYTTMATCTKENGRMTNTTERELTNGKMVMYTRDNGMRRKLLVGDHTHGLMENHTRENGKTTKGMARESKSGLMEA